MFWLRRNSAIMFDLGTTGLRAAQATRRGRRLAVRETLAVDFSEPFEQPLQEVLAEFGGRLARAAQAGRFVGRTLGLALSPPTLAFHPLKTPDALLQQPESRVREALAFELAREFRVEPGELQVRYWPLPRGHREQLNVMAVYMPSALADGLVESCARHGLCLTRIDAAPCALARACAEDAPPQPDDIWGVIDVGRSATTVTMLLGPTPVYIRTLPLAAGEWTERVAETLGIAAPDADRILHAHGLAPLARGARAGGQLEQIPRQDIPQVVAAALSESLAGLHLNVRMCLTYVEDNYPRARPARFFLTGRGGLLPGLANYLTESLAVETRPVAQSAALAPLAPGLTTAFGAALLDLEAA